MFQAGAWSRKNIQRALEYMHRDGLLVMSGIVDPAELVLMRENMTATSQCCQLSRKCSTDINS